MIGGVRLAIARACMRICLVGRTVLASCEGVEDFCFDSAFAASFRALPFSRPLLLPFEGFRIGAFQG